jgi:hypothetical protein
MNSYPVLDNIKTFSTPSFQFRMRNRQFNKRISQFNNRSIISDFEFR